MNNLILASSSPRRKEILSMLGLDFEVIPAEIYETPHLNEKPYNYVLRLAIEKSQKISTSYPESIIIGSDLTIDFENTPIGKANNRDEASEFLHKFSGKTHFTHCGYSIVKGNEVIASGVESTKITFKKLSEETINNYLYSNEWLGLAGAYGVQGSASKFVEKFEGSYFDILGLPIYRIIGELEKLKFAIDQESIDTITTLDNNKIKEFNK